MSDCSQRPIYMWLVIRQFINTPTILWDRILLRQLPSESKTSVAMEHPSSLLLVCMLLNHSLLFNFSCSNATLKPWVYLSLVRGPLKISYDEHLAAKLSKILLELHSEKEWPPFDQSFGWSFTLSVNSGWNCTLQTGASVCRVQK